MPYLTAVAATLATHAPAAATIDADGERVWSGPLSAAVVANGAHYVGGMKLAPATPVTFSVVPGGRRLRR